MTHSTIEAVELASIPADRRLVLDNLLQLYLHDFSEFAAVGTVFGEVDADGRFPYDYLDRYWQSEDCIPLVIDADGQRAGFALINRWSALDQSLDRAVAEFFILRKYRRRGVGSRAASEIFARFPGAWEVPVASYNAPALAFWRTAVARVTGSAAEEFAGDGERWTGTVLCFRTEGATHSTL